jgi:hypothetical protein
LTRCGHRVCIAALANVQFRAHNPQLLEAAVRDPDVPDLLLDHPIGGYLQRQRDSKAERISGLHVDNQLKFCGLQHRQV